MRLAEQSRRHRLECCHHGNKGEIMVRDALTDRTYWDKWIDFSEKLIVEKKNDLARPAENPMYDAEYSRGLIMIVYELVLMKYSRGDSRPELGQYFSELLDAWELSNQLDARNCREYGQRKYRDWTFSLSNLDHYIWCFWLMGLALTLEVPEDQWKRLLTLIGEEGQDHLLDRVISTRTPSWKIGEGLQHPKPYATLLKAIDAPANQQAKLLRQFVNNWYKGLNRRGRAQPYWYNWANLSIKPLSMGLYFGTWCIEAAAAAKAFNLDDSLCLDSRYYPGDLIEDGRSPRYTQPLPFSA